MDAPEKKVDSENIQQLLADMALFPEMNPGPVCRLEPDGKIIFANSEAKKVFGKENLAGHSWLEICPGMDSIEWQEVKECKTTFTFEAEIGERYFLFAHVCPENTDTIFVYGTDITSNKLIEYQLAEKTAALAEIARFPDMNPGPVIRCSSAGIILLSNAIAGNVFGLDLLGKDWRNLCPGITPEIWKNILGSVNVFPIEARILDRSFIFNHHRDSNSDLVFVFGTDITLQKSAENSLRQSEKMATLGTLAAGVAHELNNPAAATRRAAQQLAIAFTKLEQAHTELGKLNLSPDEQGLMTNFLQDIRDKVAQPALYDPMVLADREAELEKWLEEKNIENAWEIAPSLAGMEMDLNKLITFSEKCSPKNLNALLRWISTLYPVYSLLFEISEGSSRISEIVVALRNYSYLGQAPIQQINIHEGLDNTLIILRNKLKVGITVKREYAKNIPLITAYGSELNQVWTNIIDNAAFAMKGKGELIIRTSAEGEWVTVEIIDNGPGIPESIQSRIFDPFFTTKEPGKGTGLGLATSYGIITEKHKGKVNVTSHPGITKFTVQLRVNLPSQTSDRNNEHNPL